MSVGQYVEISCRWRRSIKGRITHILSLGAHDRVFVIEGDSVYGVRESDIVVEYPLFREAV